MPQTGHLQQKFIFSQLWRLEIWDQGSYWVRSWRGLAFWLPGGHHLTLLTWPSPSCVQSETETGAERDRAPRGLFFLGHQSYWIRAPPFWPHLIIITSLEALCLNTAMWWVRTSTGELWGDTDIQFITPIFGMEKADQWPGLPALWGDISHHPLLTESWLPLAATFFTWFHWLGSLGNSIQLPHQGTHPHSPGISPKPPVQELPRYRHTDPPLGQCLPQRTAASGAEPFEASGFLRVCFS